MTIVDFLLSHIFVTVIVTVVLCAMAGKILDYEPNKWVPRKCTWPLKEGWAVYNPRKKTILDSGLTFEQATTYCELMNRRKK